MASPRSPDIRDQAEAFARHHLSGLVTLLFTDMVDSTSLKQQLGGQSFDFFEQHHRLIRETLARYPNAREIETAGEHWLQSVATGTHWMPTWRWSRAFLARLDQDAKWPNWIPAPPDP